MNRVQGLTGGVTTGTVAGNGGGATTLGGAARVMGLGAGADVVGPAPLSEAAPPVAPGATGRLLANTF